MYNQGGDVESLFSKLVRNRGELYVAKLKAIINENEKRGRLKWFLEQGKHNTAHSYVKKVMVQYDQDHDYIESLQLYKVASAWEDTQQKAQEIAYRILSRWGFGQAVCASIAEDISQEACLKILFAHYPYDSSFDAWFYVIVKHVSRKFANQLRTDEQKYIDIEKVDYKSYLDIKLDATQEELNKAIGQLSQIQQDVILAHYILDISLADIAKELNIDRNTIYKRRYDACQRLRKILKRSEH